MFCFGHITSIPLSHTFFTLSFPTGLCSSIPIHFHLQTVAPLCYNSILQSCPTFAHFNSLFYVPIIRWFNVTLHIVSYLTSHHSSFDSFPKLGQCHFFCDFRVIVVTLFFFVSISCCLPRFHSSDVCHELSGTSMLSKIHYKQIEDQGPIGSVTYVLFDT